MSIGNTLRAAFGLKPPRVKVPGEQYQSIDDRWIPLQNGTWQIGQAVWPTWDPAIAAKDGYAKLALIYRCVNVIAHALGTAPIRVLDEADDNEAIDDHPMRQLMKRPNPQMGEAAFWSHVGTRMAASGFCVVEKERDRAGSVIALWPLQSSWLKARKRSDGSYDWEYKIPRAPQTFTLQSEDVIPFTWADSPTGSPYGLGPMEACFREIGLSNTMTDFLKAFMDHGAMPVHAAIPDTMPGQTLSQKRIDQLTQSFVARHGGLDKAAELVILQGIKDIKRLGFDFNELAYTDLRDLSELAIVQAFGIPATIAQVRVGLEHSDSRANAESDEGKFYRQTIIPLWARLDDRLTLGLLPDFDDSGTLNLEFDTSKIQAMQEDRNAKAVWTGAAVTGGYLSVHAWHREMGLPIPEGDDYYLRGFATMAIPATDPLGTSVDTGLPTLGAGRTPLALRATTYSAGPLQRYAAANTGRSLITRVAKQRQGSIKQFFREQGKRIVPKVTEGLSGVGPQETYELAIDWVSENTKLKAVVQQLHELAGRTAFTAIEKQFGIDPGIAFDVANPNVKRMIDQLGSRIVDITNGTKEDVSRLVAKGLDEGKRASEIAETISNLFDETYANRAVTIARTEAMQAYGKANALGFRESGVVDRIQMFDNPDHDEDYGASDGLTCAERDGLIDDLDSAEDHLDAEHPNGSLTITPVLTGED